MPQKTIVVWQKYVSFSKKVFTNYLFIYTNIHAHLYIHHIHMHQIRYVKKKGLDSTSSLYFLCFNLLSDNDNFAWWNYPVVWWSKFGILQSRNNEFGNTMKYKIDNYNNSSELRNKKYSLWENKITFDEKCNILFKLKFWTLTTITIWWYGSLLFLNWEIKWYDNIFVSNDKEFNRNSLRMFFKLRSRQQISFLTIWNDISRLILESREIILDEIKWTFIFNEHRL